MAEVKVVGRAKEPHKQAISARTHAFAADAPTNFGGQDSAPNPHELLLGSLGACTAITLQMYAQRKGWDLQEVSVDVRDEEIEDPNHAGKKITKLTRDISISGNLSQEEIDSLRAVADKCPIHKILSGNQIVTEMKRLTNV